MNIQTVLLVGLGGFLGSISRYLLVSGVDARFNSAFPFGTFAVNIIGSFCLGLLYGWLAQKDSDTQYYKLFLVTGFCGGFTTFSAFAFENLMLFQNRESLAAFGYIILSVLAGIVAVFLGNWLITR